jgi:hypothetical protein
MLIGLLAQGPIWRAIVTTWAAPAVRAVDRSWGDAQNVLAVVVPIGMIGGAIVLRRRALQTGAANDAPMFWLVVGCFIGIVRAELGLFVREATLIGGGLLQLGSGELQRVMWVVSFASPALLLASTYLWIRFRAPSPGNLVRTHLPILGMVIACVAALAGFHATSPAWQSARGLLARDVVADAMEAWTYAHVLLGCALPTLVGSTMLRLRVAPQ